MKPSVMVERISEELDAQFRKMKRDVIETLTKADARLVTELKILTLKPGDIVVIETEYVLTLDQADTLRTRMKEHLDKAGVPNVDVVVLSSGLRMAAILSPEKGE